MYHFPLDKLNLSMLNMTWNEKARVKTKFYQKYSQDQDFSGALIFPYSLHKYYRFNVADFHHDRVFFQLENKIFFLTSTLSLCQ